MADYIRIGRGQMIFPGGKILGLKPIGKGMFSKAYLATNGKVYVVTKDEEGDLAKEILAQIYLWDKSRHLPRVVKVGMTWNANVYQMPLYDAPLRKANAKPEQWRAYQQLKACVEEVNSHPRIMGNSPFHDGYDHAIYTIDCLKAAKANKAFIRALQLLVDGMANYGSTYSISDIGTRNLATDAAGNIILLDVVYDRELVAKRRMASGRRNPARKKRLPAFDFMEEFGFPVVETEPPPEYKARVKVEEQLGKYGSLMESRPLFSGDVSKLIGHSIYYFTALKPGRAYYVYAGDVSKKEALVAAKRAHKKARGPRTLESHQPSLRGCRLFVGYGDKAVEVEL